MTIVCPNGVTHTITGDDDFIEVIVDGEFVNAFSEQELEDAHEEWEIEEFATDESHADYLRSQKRFYLPNLKSIVDESKSMDVYEIAKAFRVKNFFLAKGWIRYVDNGEEESSFDGENRDHSLFL